MAKKLKMLLLILFSLNFTQIWADETRLPVLNYADECTAPAPDSLRVEDANEDYIRLAWIPAWPGATHTLEVLQETSTGGWASLFTVYNVAGSSYDVYGLNHIGTKYRFVLATNCPETGDPSIITTHFDWIGLILDLIVDGRTPINPQIVPECTTVNYEEHEWVGFKISLPNSGPGNYSGGTGLDYYFEFDAGGTEDYPNPIIKRIDNLTTIVAGEEDGEFPIEPENPLVQILGNFDIYMYRIKSSPIPYNFGKLILQFDDIGKTVSICKDPNEFWDVYFSFSMLTANTTSGLIKEGESDSKLKINDRSNKKSINLHVNNPIGDLLSISFHNNNFEHSESRVTVNLIDISGNTTLSESFNNAYNIVNIPISHLPDGFYFVVIQLNNEIPNVLKIQKL